MADKPTIPKAPESGTMENEQPEERPENTKDPLREEIEKQLAAEFAAREKLLLEKIRSLESELAEARQEGLREKIEAYLASRGITDIPLDFESLDAAEKFAEWFLARKKNNSAVKPYAKQTTRQIPEEERLKRESDKFLKNLFPWMN